MQGGGYRGSDVEVFLSACKVFTIVHEVGHALGLMHEQRRADRDDYIHVDESCVSPDATMQNQMRPWDPLEVDGADVGPFDFDSIMLYDSKSSIWKFNGEPDRVQAVSPDMRIWIDSLIDDDDVDAWSHSATVRWDNPCTGIEQTLTVPIEWGTTKPYLSLLDDPFDQLGSCGEHDLNVTRYSATGEKDCYTMSGLDGSTWSVPKAISQGDLHGLYFLYADVLDNGLPEEEDRFGSAVASGDFNGDGVMDLAIGAPGENGDNGAVYLQRGTYGAALGVGDYPTFLAPWGRLNADPSGEAGAALAAGDFDGDGYDDLAVGIPGDDSDRGAVEVFLGGFTGLRSGDSIILYASDAPDRSNSSNQERMGAALAVGDFNSDGVDDLAVGAPNGLMSVFDGQRSLERTGVVYVFIDFLGSPSALVLDPHQSGFGVSGPADEIGFGAALVAGDFNGDGDDDLAIGAPEDFEVTSGVRDANAGQTGAHASQRTGSVYTATQRASGLDPIGHRSSSLGYDHFGAALAAGDIDGDGAEELVVGAPHADISTHHDSGAVYVYHGNAYGLDASASTWRQSDFRDVDPYTAVPEDSDRFGAALAMEDIDRDGLVDLVVGAPGETGGSATSGVTGAAYIYRATASGLEPDAIALSEETGAHTGAEGGSALAIADVSGSGAAQVIVGMPEAGDDGGRVFVFDGATVEQDLSQVSDGE